MVIEKPRRGEEKYIGRNEKKLKSFKTCMRRGTRFYFAEGIWRSKTHLGRYMIKLRGYLIEIYMFFFQIYSNNYNSYIINNKLTTNALNMVMRAISTVYLPETKL